MQIRLRQLSTEDAIPGQLLGLVGGVWAPVDLPSEGSGTGGPGFNDDFERADTPLAGDNDWFAAPGFDPGDLAIVGGKVVQSPATANGWEILHARGGAADVADVTFSLEGGPVGQNIYLMPCGESTFHNYLEFICDGSVGFYNVTRYIDNSSEGPTTITDLGWVGWGVGEAMVIRLVYTEATRMLEVYQNDVLALTCDISDANFGYGHELNPLWSMPQLGFGFYTDLPGPALNSVNVPDGVVSGPVLDDMIDVDTTTTAPADQQFLKFDVASGLWVPADLPSSSTGAPFDVTDTPEDPPPYAGYAYMTSDGKVRIWSGTEWRELTTVLYEPPGEGDPDIDLASLIGRYKAADLSYADGVAVAAWPDSSAAGNDLVTVTAGTMETVGIGGLPSVVFDTFTAYNLPVATGRPCTLVVVMQNTDSGEGSIVFSSPGGVAPYLGMLNGVGWRASDGSNVLDVALSTPLDPHVYYTQFDAGVVTGGYDGGLSTTASVNIVTIQRIGRYESAPSYSMTGLVSEILVYDAVLTSGELDAIAVSLGTTYGITVTP